MRTLMVRLSIACSKPFNRVFSLRRNQHRRRMSTAKHVGTTMKRPVPTVGKGHKLYQIFLRNRWQHRIPSTWVRYTVHALRAARLVIPPCTLWPDWVAWMKLGSAVGGTPKAGTSLRFSSVAPVYYSPLHTRTSRTEYTCQGCWLDPFPTKIIATILRGARAFDFSVFGQRNDPDTNAFAKTKIVLRIRGTNPHQAWPSFSWNCLHRTLGTFQSDFPVSSTYPLGNSRTLSPCSRSGRGYKFRKSQRKHLRSQWLKAVTLHVSQTVQFSSDFAWNFPRGHVAHGVSPPPLLYFPGGHSSHVPCDIAPPF